MSIKTTVLSENYVIGHTGAIAEHGWSVFIEADGKNFLFDTGQGKALLNNARVFKKDLSAVDKIMLSHHHFDHTGGLLDALSVTGPVDVYVHPDLFKDSYSKKNNEIVHAGIPFTRPLLENRGAIFHLNTKWCEIAPGIHLTGEVPRKTWFEKGDKDLVVKSGGDYVHDDIQDDQSLVLETKKGLFIILGCAHAGLINIIDYVIKQTGKTHIEAIIGGTHLGWVSKQQMSETVKALKEYDIGKIGVSHCTGLNSSMVLAREFGEKFFFCNVGSIVEV